MTESRVDPWSFIQPSDVARMGSEILDAKEQQRWSRAVMLAGSLPYMWRHKAATLRDHIYDRLQLAPGDRVLIIGEMVEACGFDRDIRDRIGPTGSLEVIDITEPARDAAIAGRRGPCGQIGTWPWRYTEGFAAESFDAVAILQAVQHADDWRETGAELVRIAKPGATVMLAEITFSPKMRMLAAEDIHIETWIEKLAARLGFDPFTLPYWSADHLLACFGDRLADPRSLVWKGIEVVWGQKP